MKKKGFTAIETLAVIIFVAIVGIILGGFVQRAARMETDMLPEILCKNSIVTASAKRVPDFDCEIKREEKKLLGEVVIKKEDFEEEGSKVVQRTYIQDLVKKELADSMYDCWDMVERGKLNPYNPKALSEVWLSCNEFDYNLICSIVSFEGFEEDMPYVKGLGLWMANNKPPLHEQTYFEILYDVVPDNDTIKALIDKSENPESWYNTSEEYAVVWKVVFGKDPIVRTSGFKEQLDVVVLVPYSEIIELETGGYCYFVMN